MLTPSENEQGLYYYLESEGMLGDFDPEMLRDFSGKVIFGSCGDCDHFDELYEAQRALFHELISMPVRLHAIGFNGGAMRGCSHCGVNNPQLHPWMQGLPGAEIEALLAGQQYAAETFITEIMEAVALKQVAFGLPPRVILSVHMPCGKMRQKHVAPNLAIEAMFATKKRIKRYADIWQVPDFKVMCLLQWYDGSKRTIHPLQGKLYKEGLERQGKGFKIAA